MARTPEFARGTSQFIERRVEGPDGKMVDNITRRPSKHTIRATLMGLDVKPGVNTPNIKPLDFIDVLSMSPKERSRHEGKIKKAKATPRSEISKRQHLNEGLSIPVDTITAVNYPKPNMPEKVIVYADPQIHEQNGSFAGLSHQLSVKEQQAAKPVNPDDEQINPEELREPVVVWSLDSMQEHMSSKVPGENEDWYDYAATAIDLRS